MPFIDKMIIRLIKSYFNLFNPKYEKKVNFINKGIKLRRLSINRIFVSKAELKHTNSKIIITIYIYNRQKTENSQDTKNITKNSVIKDRNTRFIIDKKNTYLIK